MDRWRGIVLVIAAFACLGCVDARPPDPATHLGRLALAELPGALAAADRGLQAELALVKQQRGLPLDLTPAGEGPNDGSSKSEVEEQLNLAFPPLSRSLVRAPLDSIYSGGPLALSPVQIEQGRDLLRKHAAACDTFRAALPSQQGPHESGGLGSRLCDGMLADLRFLEPLDLGCRLEAVAAAVKIADGEPAAAIAHLRTLLATARLLAAEPNVTTRVAATNIRRDAIAVLAAIVAHDQCTADLHQELFDLLSEQTSDWPADSIAWIGDRAAGLVTYELVREGHYLSLLAADDVERLKSQQNLEATARAALRSIDADERFYLQAMHQLIDACERPYSDRQDVLSAIRRELLGKEQSSDYPLVAGTLLLADFETAQRLQAEDFARCQAWRVALGAALGQEPPTPVANSLTGQAYQVSRTPLAVTVSCVLPQHDEPCHVPLPPPRQARRE